MNSRMTAFARVLLAGVLSQPAAPPAANLEDGAAWVEVARKHAAAGAHDAAIAAWRRAIELGGSSKGDAEVEIAALEAAADRPDHAIAALDRALAAGYRFRPRLAKDPRFASLVRRPRWAEITGTATAAAGTAAAWRAPNHFGNEAQFVLPHSGVRGTISSGWNQPVSGRDERVWIAPSVRVESSSTDYFAGRDPVLARILSEIAGRK